MKAEDTPGLGKVVHRDDGTFKLSEDDMAIGNGDANTIQGCCVSVYIVLFQVAASPVWILQKVLSCSYYIHLPASFPKNREDYTNRMWGQRN